MKVTGFIKRIDVNNNTETIFGFGGDSQNINITPPLVTLELQLVGEIPEDIWREDLFTVDVEIDIPEKKSKEPKEIKKPKKIKKLWRFIRLEETDESR